MDRYDKVSECSLEYQVPQTVLLHQLAALFEGNISHGLIARQSVSEGGYYNPVVLHKKCRR